MHGVSRGKIQRVLQRMTYRHGKGQTYIEPLKWMLDILCGAYLEIGEYYYKR